MTKISYYSKCFNVSEYNQISIQEMIDIIKSDKLKRHTDYLRSEKDKDVRDNYKKNNLPAVSVAGVFKKRANNQLEIASGFSVLDIDIYEIDISEEREELKKEPSIFSMFTSPSGGLKIIIKIPIVTNDLQYKQVYAQILEHFAKFAPTVDEKTKDISRLCFLSYDPLIYVNEKSVEFKVDWNKKYEAEIGVSKIDLEKIKNGVGRGSRDDTAFRLSCRYKGKKLEQWETLLMIRQWNAQNKEPLKDDDIVKCVESAYRYTEDNLANKKAITLQEIHSLYKNLLYIEDTKRIDVVLAVALSKKLSGIPLWLILVGPSGDMKSVQLNSFRSEDTYVLHNMTSKTLVNGHKDKRKHPDLAPRLDKCLVIIPDMAQILKLPPIEKGELWGQLRDLYDGLAGKASGDGCDVKYSGLKVTLLAGSTPSIDGQILVHQDLGTRELIYRTSGNKNKEKVVQKCFENEEMEKEIAEQLKNMTTDFVESRDIKRQDISKDILEEIKDISIYVTFMRATAEFDNYSNELRNIVYPEEPTRIAKQLKRLYICLKSLDDNYSDLDAFKILWHIARSSAFPIRINIFDYLIKNNDKEFSTSQLSDKLMIGKSTAKRECLCMENMGILTCRRIETSYPDKFYDYWKINMDKVNSFIKNRPSILGRGILEINKINNNIYSYYMSMDGLESDTSIQKCDTKESSKEITQDIVEDLKQPQPIVVVEEMLNLFKLDQEISTEWLITYFGNEDGVLDALKQLSKKGDIIEVRPDTWKILC